MASENDELDVVDTVQYDVGSLHFRRVNKHEGDRA